MNIFFYVIMGSVFYPLQKGQKWAEMTQKGPKLTQNGQIDPKWSKSGKFVFKMKICKNS